jgi:hypothetical protein
MMNRYLIVLNCSFFGWLAFGLPLLHNSFISHFHKYLAYFGVMACHISFYVACKVGPGSISADNVHCFDHHEYDAVLYLEGFQCHTCQTMKVTHTHCLILPAVAFNSFVASISHLPVMKSVFNLLRRNLFISISIHFLCHQVRITTVF